MDENRTRNGQYKIGLRRDVIVDNYEAVMNAPCFIEKGMIDNPDDPLIFNKENMTYNQIKVSEKILTDTTGCAWIVGYIPQDYNSQKQISKNVALEVLNGNKKVDKAFVQDKFSDREIIKLLKNKKMKVLSFILLFKIFINNSDSHNRFFFGFSN